jgi:nucleoid-associated protein YgaU
VVQPHETLRGIARDRLGDPRRFEEIAELNRDLLTDGRLTAGMRLLLPHDARPAPLRRD